MVVTKFHHFILKATKLSCLHLFYVAISKEKSSSEHILCFLTMKIILWRKKRYITIWHFWSFLIGTVTLRTWLPSVHHLRVQAISNNSLKGIWYIGKFTCDHSVHKVFKIYRYKHKKVSRVYENRQFSFKSQSNYSVKKNSVTDTNPDFRTQL